MWVYSVYHSFIQNRRQDKEVYFHSEWIEQDMSHQDIFPSIFFNPNSLDLTQIPKVLFIFTPIQIFVYTSIAYTPNITSAQAQNICHSSQYCKRYFCFQLRKYSHSNIYITIFPLFTRLFQIYTSPFSHHNPFKIWINLT